MLLLYHNNQFLLFKWFHIQTYFHSFHLFNKYLESTFCVAGTLLSAEENFSVKEENRCVKVSIHQLIPLGVVGDVRNNYRYYRRRGDWPLLNGKNGEVKE